VWGSHYAAQSDLWGFACCHSTVKNSYCAGSAAIEAAEAEAKGGLGLLSSRPPAEVPQLQIQAADPKGKRKAEDNGDGAGRKRTDIGEGDVDKRLDKKKLEAALSGKNETYGGKPVTEEELGTSLISYRRRTSCGTDGSFLWQRRTGCRRVRDSRTRWRTLGATSCYRCSRVCKLSVPSNRESGVRTGAYTSRFRVL
jgi:hypothetical protein